MANEQSWHVVFKKLQSNGGGDRAFTALLAAIDRQAAKKADEIAKMLVDGEPTPDLAAHAAQLLDICNLRGTAVSTAEQYQLKEPNAGR